MKDAILIELGVISEETMGAPQLAKCEQIGFPAGTGSDVPAEQCG